MNETRKIIENIDTKGWYDLMLRKEQYSHYIDKPIGHQIKCLQSELLELLDSVENNKDNISEEVGDVIYNTIQLLQSLFKKGLLNENELKNSDKKQKEKIYKRQPFLKEHKKPDSYESESILFYKNKSKLGKTNE